MAPATAPLLVGCLLLIVAGVCVAAIGLLALAVVEPRPPVKHFEVPVPSERFAR